ncbi:DUF6790 family protein [Thiocapsa imhoffii]|uniref:DUF6790 family protein n=1 Tax=Thiocapsa imhoffii TaxID=382777 RepID=UPI0019051B6F|nr:DUF6790 family protein [Thiocapsa imhoffii]
MIEQLIRLALSNFTLTCLILGLLASGISLLAHRQPRTRPRITEALFAWFLFFSVGISFFYNFVMHTFFGEMTAAFIGWPQSPFQAEVGFASLGFALIGFLAFRGGRGLRLAAVVGPAAFLWGAAAGHVEQMVSAHNFAPGNAGVIFYTDLLIPIIGFVLLGLTRTADHHPAARQPLSAPAASPDRPS